MSTVVRQVSTVTHKGQTTVPKSVRDALGVQAGDRIVFHVDRDRRVTVTREDDEAEDPVIDAFLEFLARDMAANPGEAIRHVPPDLAARLLALTEGATFVPDEEIEGEVDL